jgi:hypothetical protein
VIDGYITYRLYTQQDVQHTNKNVITTILVIINNIKVENDIESINSLYSSVHRSRDSVVGIATGYGLDD